MAQLAKPLRGLRVAAVVDEFTRECLAPEVSLVNLHGRWWRAQLAAFRPDILFVESAWRGARDSWKRRLASYPNHRDAMLARLVRHCQRRQIPTVFWNKEDPVHFDRFIAKASLFDYIATTDVAMVDDYCKRAGLSHDRVIALLFAAQPALHNPVAARHGARVCFAGSYGDAEFPERQRALEVLLDAAMEFDLTVYDRNSHLSQGANVFPERFRSYLRDRIDYTALTAEYRACKVFLNVNSVSASDTMFARRVFELLACGTSVVSSPSVGMQRLFGHVVDVATSTSQARTAIARLLNDESHRDARAAQGIRDVFLRHTYEDRLRQLCRLIGHTISTPDLPSVAALAFVDNDGQVTRLIETLRRQTERASVVVVGVRGMDRETVEARLADVASRTVVVRCDRFADEHAVARHAALVTGTDYVTCIALQHSYGSAYFASQLACVRFAAADLIGKPLYPDHSHRYTPAIHPHSAMMTAQALCDHGWSDRSEHANELAARYRQLTCYATDTDGFEPA